MRGAGPPDRGRYGRAALARGDVHVWEADLADLPGSLVSAVLSRQELERARRILVPARRDTWARARALLRSLLGGYLEADPRGLRFVEGAGGKPGLAGGQAWLRFSVSHSQSSAVYALAAGREVGVDLQLRAPTRALGAIAARAFTADIAGRLAELDPAARRGSFLSAWTRHEAQLKCLGVGLAGAGAKGLEDLWTLELPLAREGASTLAIDGPPARVRRRRWRPAGKRVL